MLLVYADPGKSPATENLPQCVEVRERPKKEAATPVW